MSRDPYKNWLEEQGAKEMETRAVNDTYYGEDKKIIPEVTNEDWKKGLDAIVAKSILPEEKRTDGLTKADVEALTERFLGLSPAEQMIFVDLIPVHLCLDRIRRELERAKKFEDSIKGVVNSR